MVNVSVSHLKSGARLAENVVTKRGSVLLEKGALITQREIDILHAFLIANVNIVANTVAEKEEQKSALEEPARSVLPFYKEFNRMMTLMKRVFNIVRTGQTVPILEIRTTLEDLIKKIDTYNCLTFASRSYTTDDYLMNNAVEVALTSYQLARWCGFPQKDWVQIALGGLFHDIGNVKVDDAVLYKKGKLNAADLEEIRRHTLFGYQFLKTIPAVNEGAKLCALQHHERVDGSGYPLALKNEQIHPYAKLIAVADIFHAMTNHRHYKQAESPYLVLEELLNESFGKLDPVIVQTFVNKVTSFHNGTVVRLSDNRIGEIVFSDRANPTRPWVNVSGEIVNLTQHRNLFIREVIAGINL